MTVLILLAPGFEASTALYCAEQFREAGIETTLVGATAGLIRSRNGIAIRPDYSLDQVPAAARQEMVIVPGGRQSVVHLLSDPRSYRLLTMTWDSGGYVAALASAESTMVRAGLPPATACTHYMVQGQSDLPDFTRDLIDRLM